MNVVEQIVVPLYGMGDEDALVRAGSVLASWLSVPLQLVAPDEVAADRLESTARSISVSSRPVKYLSTASFVDGLVEFARACAPALCVTTTSRGGAQLASASGQTTLLVGESSQRRLPSGPLTVEVTGRATDAEAISAAAVWTSALDVGLRLVIDTRSTNLVALYNSQDRLRAMGISAEVDRVRSRTLHPLIMAAKSHESLAMVIQPDRLDEPELLETAAREGVSVLVAPTERARPDGPMSEAPSDAASDAASEQPVSNPPDTALVELSTDECWALLEQHRVGRLAYLSDQWPTIVPVNYSTVDREIFIRSLSGAKAGAADRRDVTCLEIDEVDLEAREGWSVAAHGQLEPVTDAATLRTAWEHDPDPWVESDTWQWLRFVPVMVSGRRLSPSG